MIICFKCKLHKDGLRSAPPLTLPCLASRRVTLATRPALPLHSSKKRDARRCSVRNKKIKFLYFCFVLSSLIRIFAPTKPALAGRAGQDIDGILRSTKPFVGLTEGKGVYGRYILCVQTSQL